MDGDVLELVEVWMLTGIIHILSEYPLLPSFIIVQLMGVALRSAAGSDMIKHRVIFDTNTKTRRFESKGRRYARGFSLQNVHKWIRKSVLPVSSFEVDISNCYPSIILGICEKNIACDNLDNYVRNRRTFLRLISDCLSVRMDTAKELVLVVLSGGRWRNHLAGIQRIEPGQVKKCPFLDNLQIDIELARDHIKKTQKYKDIKKTIRREYPDEQEAKQDSLSFSVFLEQNERRILDIIMEFSSSEFNIKASSLLHDGFIVCESFIDGEYIIPDPRDSLRIPIKTFQDVLSQRASEAVGYHIEIKVHTYCCCESECFV